MVVYMHVVMIGLSFALFGCLDLQNSLLPPICYVVPDELFVTVTQIRFDGIVQAKVKANPGGDQAGPIVAIEITRYA